MNSNIYNNANKDQIKKATLSVVAISLNEEVDLPGFLENLIPWVDEIIIVDDESTDNTIRIAEAAKVKFISHKMTQ